MARALRLLSSGPGAGLVFLRKTPDCPRLALASGGPCGRGAGCLSSPSPGPDSGLSFELGAGGLPGVAVGWSGLRFPFPLQKTGRRFFAHARSLALFGHPKKDLVFFCSCSGSRFNSSSCS